VRLLARCRAPQNGVVLLALLAAVAVLASFLLASALGASGSRAAQRMRNAAVLNRAKQALIGYVAERAVQASENNPGRLPCPEAAGYVGTPREGIAAGSCSLPAIGRLPWRTLGLDKLTDAAGEPLWYAVSPGWALPTTHSRLTINSDSTGRLVLADRARPAVALIIAAGPPLTVAESASCRARLQSRGAAALNYRDYLECENASSPVDQTFASAGPNESFNDQLLPVTADDLLPLLEAAIKVRLERDIAPVLRTVYAGPQWGLSAHKPFYPYAAPFGDPGSSSYQGAAGVYQGLLPFSYSRACDPKQDARCAPTFVDWNTASGPRVVKIGGPGSIGSAHCGYSAASVAYCWGEYHGGALKLKMTAPMRAVAMALRRIDPEQAHVYSFGSSADPGSVVVPAQVSGSITGDGSAVMNVSAALPDAPQRWYYVTMEKSVLADHPLLDAEDPATGWFVRNQWYRVVYYAAVPTCASMPSTCLSVAAGTGTRPARAILVLAGRSLSRTARPNGALEDYLDSAENRDNDRSFEQLPVGARHNDRIVVVDADL
jgi:hypothetical protein